MKEFEQVYLAGPFFNQSELSFTEIVMRDLEAHFSGRLSFYVPHIHTGIILTPQSTDEESKWVFIKNLEAMNAADIYVLLLDNEDAGTCWEMGYGYGRGIPMIGFWSDVRKRPNLMLYQSAQIVSNIPDLIKKLVEVLDTLH